MDSQRGTVSCPSCDRESPADARFCMHCARPFAVSCSGCGQELPDEARFCPSCAHPVEGADAPATGEPAPLAARKPGDYTPKHLADRILQSRSALEGERKQVTVLFADVKGSMELAEELGPEEWHRVLERFFEILGEGVHRFEGTVNQYTGDGIMALFGAPVAHEDHVQRACYAALHLRKELERYATEVKRQHGVNVSTRMGLNSGDVVVGKIGDDLRMDYTAQGHTVGLAQRMESLASPNTCYVGEATAKLAEGYFELEDLGEFNVKGSTAPLHVHRLVGLGGATTRFDVSRARGLTRFVGREGDMHMLDDALAQTRAGNGQVVGVVAPAGTGKSRLCFEFTERCRAARLEIFEGHAVAHGKNIPFLPILEIFRAYFGVVDGDSERTVREKVAGKLLLIDEALRNDLPVMFDFLGVPDADTEPLKLDAEARQQKLFALIHRLAHDDEGTEPRIYVVEDMHWIDGGSERFVEQMVEAVAGTRNLLLVNFRPEYHASWMSRSWYRQLPLAPLGPDAIRELLDHLIGQDPSTAGLAATIHERTGGNPFFTEEVVQSLIESGHLEGAKGAYRLVTPIERLAVPASVHAVLAARIDRLIEREKQVLQAAAVIGKDFVRPILEDVVELSSNELDLAISILKDGEFVREQALYPVAEYAFKHPLTQEVALDSLLGDRKRALHRAVAMAIEAARAEALDENAPLLAHHWESAGEAGTAARWHRRAAQWAGTTDSAQALHHWRQVRELLAGHEGDEELRLRLVACHGILAAGWRVGVEKDLWEELYVEGRSIAQQLGDGDGEALLVQVYSRGLPGIGEVERYVEVAEEGLQLADRIVDVGTRANAWILGMDAYQWSGRYDRIVELGDEYVAKFPDDPAVGFEIWQVGLYPLAVMLRGVGHTWMAHFEDAQADFDRSTGFGVELEQWELANWGYQMQSALAWLRGDATRGPASGRRAVEAGERAGSTPALRAGGARAVTLGHLAANDWDAAIAAGREWLDVHDREQVELQYHVEARAVLCESLCRAGRYPDVIELAEQTIEDAMRMPRAASEVIARNALAVALACTDGRGAREGSAEVLAPVEGLIAHAGAHALEPQRHEALAHVARAFGEAESHERELREAHRLYTKFGAPGHAERVTRELEGA